MPNPEKDKTTKKKTVSEELLSGIWDSNAPTETEVKPKPVNGKHVAAETKTVSSQLLEGIFDGNGQIKKKVSDNESDVSLTEDQASPSVSGNTESISGQPNKPQPNSVFSLLGKGLNYIQANLVSPVANALSDVEQNVKDKILQSPDLLSKFKKDVQTHYDDKIGHETSYAGGQYNLSNVPVVSDRGRELIKERDNYLKELDDNAAILVGGLTPVETKYLDENGKTKYKTEYVKNETVLPVNYKPLDPKPDINIEISKMGNIGKELMKITNPTQAQQLDANATPYLAQQAQYMGVTARAKYLKSELDKRVEGIKNDPAQSQALNDYIEGKANTGQIDFLVKSGIKPLYDEYNGLSNLSTEITHSNPAIREGFLKKAIFNELNNRYGSSNGFLGTQGWNEEQLNTVVNDYKKKLTDPRDLKLLDNISEQKELGSLTGDNQSWAAQMAKQFYGTLWNTGKYISNDLLAVDIPNIINPANRDNRNKEQQLNELKQADADKSNVTIDFKPDKKQFFLKQYVDANPDSETFLQTKENKGEMDGSFADKVLYNSAAQFGQLGAQIAMASALPTFGRVGFDLTKAVAPAEFIESKSINFLNKVALPAFAMTYDSNYKQSFDVVGTKDVWKNNLYATLNASFEGATELLGNPLEQAKFLTSAFKKDIGNFVKNLSVSELQKMGQEGFKERVKNIALESLKGLGRGAAGAAGEANEEALNDILTGTTQAIFNPNYTTPSNVIQQAGQTWLETFAGMGFMPATGVVSSARSGWGSKLSQDALTFIAQNKQAAIENINQSVADKTITQDEANQKIHLVNTAALAHEQSRNAATVQAVTTGKKISKSNLAALTMARSNEIELDNQIAAAKKTNDVALEVTLEDKKNQYVEIRKSLINDEMWIDPITGTPEVPPIADAPEPQQTSADELQPNEPVTVSKIKAVKGQNEEQAKAFDTHKNEANNWLDNENTRLRNIFGKIPFKDFKKEYDTVKETYLKKIGEAVTLSQSKTESDGKNKEANAQETEGRQNEVLTQTEGTTENLVPSDLKVESVPESTVVGKVEQLDLDTTKSLRLDANGDLWSYIKGGGNHYTRIAENVTEKNLAEHIGEAAAKKLLAATPEHGDRRIFEKDLAEIKSENKPTVVGDKPSMLNENLKDVAFTTKALEGVDKDKLPLLRDVASNILNEYETSKKEVTRLNDEKNNLDAAQRTAIIKKTRYKKSEKYPDKYEFNTGASIIRKTEQQLIDDYYDSKIKKIKKDAPIEKVLDIYRKQDREYSSPKAIAEAYHKAKADNSNPELAKAVEEALNQKPNETKEKAQELLPTKDEGVTGNTGQGSGGEVISEQTKESSPATTIPVENVQPTAETKDIKQKGKELADKIRSLRPKKDGTAKATIFALPIAIYDTAIVTIVNAVELTGDLAQAINEGVKYIQSQVSDWKDKDGKFEQHINDFVEGKKPKITAQTTDEDVAKPKEETDKKKESNEKRANTNELNKLATDIVGIDEVKKYLSGKTIEKHTGEKPTNPQEYISTDLQKAFEQGENIIDKAKALFGDKYVSELLDYLNRANISIAAKSLVYVSLANDLYKEKKAFPDRFEEITKLQFMVNRDAQAFAHDVSVALGLRRLQNLQLYGADTSNIADSILTPVEQEQKNELEDAVQADDKEVNNEFEQQENNEEDVTEQAETAKDVEQDKKDKKSKKDTRKKSPKSQWKAVTIDADALKQKMDEIKNKINKLDC